jgi:hypothetical protein
MRGLALLHPGGALVVFMVFGPGISCLTWNAMENSMEHGPFIDNLHWFSYQKLNESGHFPLLCLIYQRTFLLGSAPDAGRCFEDVDCQTSEWAEWTACRLLT